MHIRITRVCRITFFYPLPEDDQEYEEEQYNNLEDISDNDQLETVQDHEISTKEDRKR